MEATVREVIAMYNFRIQSSTAGTVSWTVFVVQLLYSLLYYFLAASALHTRLPKQYQMFANCGLIGILGLVFLAYVDKFNLLVFFLRLISYIYAKYLQGLTVSLLLLPPTPLQLV